MNSWCSFMYALMPSWLSAVQHAIANQRFGHCSMCQLRAVMRMWSPSVFYFIHTVVIDMGRGGGGYPTVSHTGLAIGVRVHLVLGWSIVARMHMVPSAISADLNM